MVRLIAVLRTYQGPPALVADDVQILAGIDAHLETLEAVDGVLDFGLVRVVDAAEWSALVFDAFRVDQAVGLDPGQNVWAAWPRSKIPSAFDQASKLASGMSTSGARSPSW